MAVFGIGGDKKLFGGSGANQNQAANQNQVNPAVANQSPAEPVNVNPAAPQQAAPQQPAPVKQAVAENNGKDLEIEELTSKIGEVENVIREIYGDIGEKYFELHQDDAEAELVSMVNDIKGRNELIADYRGKINELRGIIICDKCGVELKNTATFCTECGNKIKKSAESAPNGFRTCSNCNSFIEAGAKFCSVCGSKVEETVPVQQAAAKVEKPAAKAPQAPQPVQQAQETVETVEAPQAPQPAAPAASQPVVTKAPKVEVKSDKKCPFCGQALEEFDVMCFACGNKLEEE